MGPAVLLLKLDIKAAAGPLKLERGAAAAAAAGGLAAKLDNNSWGAAGVTAAGSVLL